MFYIYSRKLEDDKCIYDFKEEKSLFGCNVGLIPQMLKNVIIENHQEPFKWGINVRDILDKIGYHNSSILIDINPYNKLNKYITICELIDIWGYSSSDWTPLLFRLTVVVEAEDNKIDKKHFVSLLNNNEVIYSLLYAQGTVKNGEIVGKWIAPRGSSTNTPLLWPEILKYFLYCIHKNDPKLFNFIE